MVKRIVSLTALAMALTLSGCMFFPYHDDEGPRGGHGGNNHGSSEHGGDAHGGGQGGGPGRY
ncbi:hypothetical protein [Phytohalomonas tamaricis]|uniref:hypothetical protein n=1 Tax=Phytohalomonas tamaricis TaxID=2081032 RepID=UPI000D0B9B15|nr:hypothetical protein [Phytohalomonas tamaricis]